MAGQTGQTGRPAPVISPVVKPDRCTGIVNNDKDTMELPTSISPRTVSSPVKNTSASADLIRKSMRMASNGAEECIYDEECINDEDCADIFDDESELREPPKKVEDKVSIKDFTDDIQTDLIKAIDYRILCRFLGLTSVNDIKNHPYVNNPLITLMLMECLPSFMKEQGFDLVGELNFNSSGDQIPPAKTVWKIRGKELSFTTTSFLYFKKKNGRKRDNVAFYLYGNIDREVTAITCFTSNEEGSEKYINKLENYTKKHNCLQGLKLKDVNMFKASFAEVENDSKYDWENYYFDDDVINLFNSEVFGFLDNVEKYNKNGICKRGIILFSEPGAGKTTLGHIVCNKTDKTVIWITPEILEENNHRALSSIKLLYKLADFLLPCLFILEDLDLFSGDREKGGDTLRLGALMNILDGVNSINNSITLGTTNRLDSIELALRNRPGRFDRIIEILPLSDSLREKMFKNRLKEWKHSNDIIKHIVKNTKEWTGAEAQELINTLNLEYINNGHKKRVLTVEMVDKSIETMKKFGVGSSNSTFGFNKTEKAGEK